LQQGLLASYPKNSKPKAKKNTRHPKVAHQRIVAQELELNDLIKLVFLNQEYLLAGS